MVGRETVVDVLGPLRVVVAGRELRLGAPKQQAVLAMLLLNANSVVSKEALIDGVWGEDPPPAARGNLYTYLSNLRAMTQGSQLHFVRVGGGYRLEFDPGLLDLSRVRGLIDERPLAEDGPRQALERVEAALRQWKSAEALVGVPGPFAEQRRAEFGRLRLRLLLTRARLCIEDQRPERAVDQLAAERAGYPFDEQLVTLLITALTRAGRPGEAMALFIEFRETLIAELGVEPGVEVQQARERIAPFDPARGTVRDDEPTFVGRAAELDAVLSLASSTSRSFGRQSRALAPVVVVVGEGGIGKTAFAAECARQLRDEFPDGKVRIELNGFASNLTSLSSYEALHALLTALGHDKIPDNHDARLARYREAMRTARRLVILDSVNVDLDALGDLVDVGPGNFVIVTSRDRLAKLTGRHVHRVPLPRLTAVEARSLLISRIERERVGSQHVDLGRLSRLCDHLPLALHIAAQQINSRPGLDVSGLVDEFSDASRRLDLFQLDDTTHPRSAAEAGVNSVRAAFLWAYGRLEPDAARVLRLLAGLPCTVFPPLLVAAVANETPATASRTIAQLLEHHLLHQSSGGYILHDLTRACALEIAAELDGPRVRDDAVDRAAGWYFASLAGVNDLMGEPQYTELSWFDGTPQFISVDSFATWMSVHSRQVAALVPAVQRAGHPDHAWKLAHVTFEYYHFSGRLSDWRDILGDGLTAAVASADRVGQIRMLNSLGAAYSLMGAHDKALDAYGQLIPLLDDSVGIRLRSVSMGNLAMCLLRARRHEEAFDQATAALQFAEAHPAEPSIQFMALSTYCQVCAETGRPELAIERIELALATEYTHEGFAAEEPSLLLSLGRARLNLNEVDNARAAYRRAAIVARGLGYDYFETAAEFGLAQVEHLAGNTDLAVTVAQRARQRFHETGAEVEEEDVEVFLAEIAASGSTNATA